jgi:uncharacterized membrane protein
MLKSKVKGLVIDALLSKTIKISVITISLALLVFYMSSAFNVHAQQGGSVTTGPVTGGSSTGPNSIGGNVSTGAVSGGNSTSNNSSGPQKHGF